MSRLTLGLALAAALTLGAACATKTAGPAGGNQVAPPVVAAADAGAADAPSGAPKIDFQEAEFSENEKSRDPFRSYAPMFVAEARGKVKSQREVLLDQYSVDELKLIGIVTGIAVPKAMLVDPTGKGHVVQRGQFLGRPEVVQENNATGRAYEINWRVDRIRDGDVVLIREDPQNRDVPSATKVIPLRPEGTVVSE
jgi:type IV pilus assembly protein PilP